MVLNQTIVRSLTLPTLALALGLASSPRARAQALESDATTNSVGTTTSLTIAAASRGYTDPVTGNQALAYARTDYGYNHAYSKIVLGSDQPYFSSSSVSRYTDAFTVSVTHAFEGLLTPTSARFTVTLDGTMYLPTGYDQYTQIEIGSGNSADGHVSASTSDGGASLFENTGTDAWNLSSSVSGTTYTSQSYHLTGGSDVVTILLYSEVYADGTSFTPGYGYIDFRNTGVLSGIQVYDQYKTLIPSEDLIITPASGGHYQFLPPTPEPSSFAMLAAFGITAIAGARRARQR